MYTDNSRWSRLFVLLSLLSTGLSIVAAGLLFDYSSRLLHQSDLGDSRPARVAAVSESAAVDADRPRLYAPGQLGAVRVSAPVRAGVDGAVASLRAVERSILIDALRHEIGQRIELLRDRASQDLVVLEPAAPEIQIRNDVARPVPQSIPLVRRSSSDSRGG